MKNKLLKFLTLVLVLALSFSVAMFVGCGNDEEKDPEKEPEGSKTEFCVVSFDTDGGFTLKSRDVKKGQPLYVLSDAEKPGFAFDRWELNGEVFTSTTKVESDITIKAIYKAVEFRLGGVYDIDSSWNLEGVTCFNGEGAPSNSVLKFNLDESNNKTSLYFTEMGNYTLKIGEKVVGLFSVMEYKVLASDFNVYENFDLLYYDDVAGKCGEFFHWKAGGYQPMIELLPRGFDAMKSYVKSLDYNAVRIWAAPKNTDNGVRINHKGTNVDGLNKLYKNDIYISNNPQERIWSFADVYLLDDELETISIWSESTGATDIYFYFEFIETYLTNSDVNNPSFEEAGATVYIDLDDNPETPDVLVFSISNWPKTSGDWNSQWASKPYYGGNTFIYSNKLDNVKDYMAKYEYTSLTIHALSEPDNNFKRVEKSMFAPDGTPYTLTTMVDGNEEPLFVTIRAFDQDEGLTLNCDGTWQTKTYSVDTLEEFVLDIGSNVSCKNMRFYFTFE